MHFIEPTKNSSKQPNILLKKARIEKGWSQQAVAAFANVPQTFMISRWENGASIPNVIYRGRLCTIFGKSDTELGFPEAALSLAPHGLDIHAPIYDPAVPIQLSNRSGLVGRDTLLNQLKELICGENEVRLLALNGLPGVGKTSIAIELSSSLEVRGSNIKELIGFVHGIDREYNAVRAGFTYSRSQGPVEGTLNKIKTHKRLMYGRASLPLLRKKMLCQAKRVVPLSQTKR